MEHIKILDELLRYLSTTEHTQFSYIRNDVNNKSKYLKDINNSTFHSALMKLEKDGYVNSESKGSIDPLFKSPRKDHYYKISFEGLVFINEGGYENEYRKNQKEQIEYSDLQKRQSLLEEKQLKTQNQLVFLTFLVAVGTLIAGLYYVLEILDFFCILTTKKR